jgi:hypothetical protein
MKNGSSFLPFALGGILADIGGFFIISHLPSSGRALGYATVGPGYYATIDVFLDHAALGLLERPCGLGHVLRSSLRQRTPL